MARIPHSTLRQVATIEPYEGQAGDGGAVFGGPVTVRARVEARNRRMTRLNGVEVVATAVAFIRPEVTVGVLDRPPAAEDRFTVDTDVYEVLEVQVGRGLSRPTHRELVLAPAPVAA